MNHQTYVAQQQQAHRERVQRREERQRRFSLTPGGQAFLAWMIAEGMPIPQVDAPAVLPLAVIAAVALVDGEVIEASPGAPGYPMAAWMTAHKDEIAAILPVFFGVRT